MKLSKLLSVTLLSVFPISSQAQEWIKVWEDEFDYTGLPDSTKWTYDVGGSGWGNQESQFYTPKRLENAKVENGFLAIKSIKEKYQGRDFTSARIKTQGVGDWKYGKVEVRAQLPTGKGLWSAIWMLPSESKYGNWPASGEIDIMENVGYLPATTYFTVHTDAYNHVKGTQKGGETIVASPFSQFHIYRLEWFSDSIKGYVDNTLYFSFKKAGDYKTWPFDQKFHLLLNTAVGGTWGGSQGIDSTKFPQTFLIDYVRVYQLPEGVGPFTITAKPTARGQVLKSPDAASYPKGSEVQVTAQSNAGYEFRRWYGSKTGVARTLSMPMYFNYEQKAEFVRKGEMLQNPIFLGGTAFWSYYGATLSTPNDTLWVTLPSATANPWDVQMSQMGFSLKSGKKYRFRVTAKTLSSSVKTIVASVGISQDPWSSYLSRTLSLTTSFQTFDYVFTMNGNDENARVVLDLGKQAGDVVVSEISLVDEAIATSLEEEAIGSGWHLYPTIVEDAVQLESVHSNLPTQANLYSAEGKYLKTFPVTSSKMTLSLVDQKAGVYIMEIMSAHYKIRRKLVKK